MEAGKQHGASINRSGNRAKWVFAACVAIAAYFLIASRQVDLSGLLEYLPLLLLLACPLMHLFMHRGHGKHASSLGEKHTLQRGGDT